MIHFNRSGGGGQLPFVANLSVETPNESSVLIVQSKTSASIPKLAPPAGRYTVTFNRLTTGISTNVYPFVRHNSEIRWSGKWSFSNCFLSEPQNRYQNLNTGQCCYSRKCTQNSFLGLKILNQAVFQRECECLNDISSCSP